MGLEAKLRQQQNMKKNPASEGTASQIQPVGSKRPVRSSLYRAKKSTWRGVHHWHRPPTVMKWGRMLSPKISSSGGTTSVVTEILLCARQHDIPGQHAASGDCVGQTRRGRQTGESVRVRGKKCGIKDGRRAGGVGA